MSSAEVIGRYEVPINTTGNWGRKDSYGGLGNLSSRPLASQKGHFHFGSGADAQNRGLPQQQYYDITRLHRSHVRRHDETIPDANRIDCSKLMGPPTTGDPLASHRSHQALFPDPTRWKENEGGKYREPSPLDRAPFTDEVSPREKSADRVRFLKPELPGDYASLLTPRLNTTEQGDLNRKMKLPAIQPSKTQVLKKACGNFGRVEVLNPALPALPEEPVRSGMQDIAEEERDADTDEGYHDDLLKGRQMSGKADVHNREYELDGIFPKKKHMQDFFSRHETVSAFHQRHPASTPIKERYWGKRPADWHLAHGCRSLGR